MEAENPKTKSAADILGAGINALALAKALLEDYAAVIAKLEGVEAEQIKARIMKRQAELFHQTKQDLLSRAGHSSEGSPIDEP